MNPGTKLLDKYAAMCKHATDSDVARALKVRPSAVNNWRHDRAMPDAASVEKMCEATGEPLSHWLPLIQAEREKSPAARKAWLRLAQVAAVLMLTVAGARAEATAPAVGPVKALITAPHCILCQLVEGAAEAWLCRPNK